jgi:hypothetical protein
VDHLFLSPRFTSPYDTNNCCLFRLSVQASIAANTWVVSGSPQTKSMLLYLFFLYLKIYAIDNLFCVCLFQCFNTKGVNISQDFFLKWLLHYLCFTNPYSSVWKQSQLMAHSFPFATLSLSSQNWLSCDAGWRGSNCSMGCLCSIDFFPY